MTRTRRLAAAAIAAALFITPVAAARAAGADDPDMTATAVPMWDAGTGRWWLWTWDAGHWTATAWWNGLAWSPAAPVAAGGTAVERRGQTATAAGRTTTYDLLGTPTQLTGLIVYLDGDGMNGVTNPDQTPLGGPGGIVEVAARHGHQVLAIRTPSSDGTWWRELELNAALVDEVARKVAAETGALRIGLVGYSGGAQLLSKALLGRGLCTSVAVLAGGGGTQGTPAAPTGACPALWATGTNDTGPGSKDGYNALADAQEGSTAYAAAGWPATIWTPPGVDHDGIRTQLGTLLEHQLTRAGQTSSTPTQAPSTAPSPTTSSSPSPTVTSPGSRTFDGSTLSGTLTSKHWPGKTVNWLVATPTGLSRGTVIVLHGKTDSARVAFDGLGLADLAKSSGYAFAAIDGDSTYWTSYQGIDTGAMVIEDFLPLLASKGLDVDQITLTGYSMGGLGALTIAQELGSTRVKGVLPMSAAVWEGGHPGAEGQAQARVRADVGKLDGFKVRIVSGTDDDLTAPNQTLAGLIPDAVTSWTPGAHDFAYWRPALADQIAWLTERYTALT